MPADGATASPLTRLRAHRGRPAMPPALQQGRQAEPALGSPPGSAGRSPLGHGPEVSPPRRRRRRRRQLPVFSPGSPEGRPVGLCAGRWRAGLTPGCAKTETSGRCERPGCGPQDAGRPRGSGGTQRARLAVREGLLRQARRSTCKSWAFPSSFLRGGLVCRAPSLGGRGAKTLPSSGSLVSKQQEREGLRGRGRALEINWQFRRPALQLAERKPIAALFGRRHFPQRGSEPAPRRGLGAAPNCPRARAASGTLGAAGPPFLGPWVTSSHRRSQQDRPRGGADAIHACVFSLASREAGLAHDPRKQMVRLMWQLWDAGHPETRVRGLRAAMWKWSPRPTGAAPTGSGTHSEQDFEPCPSLCACRCLKEP